MNGDDQAFLFGSRVDDIVEFTKASGLKLIGLSSSN
jgi:hypothetical protein